MDGSLVHDTAAQAAKKVVAGHVRIHSASVCHAGVHRAVREPTDLSSAMSLRCGSAANILFPGTTAQRVHVWMQQEHQHNVRKF